MAAERFKEAGDRPQQHLNCMVRLSESLIGVGEVAKARGYLNAALALARSEEMPQGEADALTDSTADIIALLQA